MLVDGISEPFFLRRGYRHQHVQRDGALRDAALPVDAGREAFGKMPWMTDGRALVYFGRLPNLSTRRVRDSSSSPSTPREFDDDEESFVLPIGPPHSRLEHLVEHLRLPAFDWCDVQFAKVLEPRMPARSPPSGGDPLGLTGDQSPPQLLTGFIRLDHHEDLGMPSRWRAHSSLQLSTPGTPTAGRPLYQAV